MKVEGLGGDRARITADVRLEGLSLPVADVPRSVAFYRDLLGFTVEHQSGDSFALIRVDPDGTIGLGAADSSVPDWSRGARDGLHVELGTEDLDALYEELKKRGVVFHEPPTDHPWERSMAVLDPDGFRVEFAEGRRGQPGTRKDQRKPKEE